MKRHLLFSIFFLVLVFGFPAVSSSQEDSSPNSNGSFWELEATRNDESRRFDLRSLSGNLKVRPVLSQSLTYNDNVFLEGEDASENWDWISRSTAGGELLYDTDRLDIDLEHRATYKEFVNLSDRDDWEQRSSGRIAVNLDPVTVGVSGNWSETSDPLDLVFTSRIDIIQSRFSPFITYEQGPLRVRGSYAFSRLEYREESFETQNFDQETGNIRVRYSLSDRWFLLGETRFGDTTYTEGFKNDFDFTEFTVGAGGNFSEQFRAIVEAGQLHRNHDPNSGTDPNEDDYHSWIARLTGIWTPTDSDELRAGYYRRIRESTFSNFTVRNRVKLTYEKTLTDQWDAVLEARYDQIKEATDTVARDRKEGSRLHGAVTYHVKPWLPVTASYSYQRKETNQGGGEYKNHLIRLSASFRF